MQGDGSSVKGSLYNVIDFTKTEFGSWKLKRWLASPLINISAINQWLDSVEDLMKEPEYLNSLCNWLLNLGDLERLLSWLYSYSSTQNSEAVYFENVSLQKIKELWFALEKLDSLVTIINTFTSKMKE